MGGKPRVRPEKRPFSPKNFDPSKLSRDDLIEICGEMAAVIRLAVMHGKMPEGFTFSEGGLIEKATVTERAFDCLDAIGHTVDRDKYYADKDKKKKR